MFQTRIGEKVIHDSDKRMGRRVKAYWIGSSQKIAAP